MACVCPPGEVLDGEIIDYFYCLVGACTANGQHFPKQYWVNKSILCRDANGNVEYVDCDQLVGCCT